MPQSFPGNVPQPPKFHEGSPQDIGEWRALYNWFNAIWRSVNGGPLLEGYPVYADNGAATSGGLAKGNYYRTDDGTIKIVY